MGVSSNPSAAEIPLPIVALNRATIVITIVAGLALGQPAIITALLVVLVAALAFGPRGSLIFQVGSRLLRRQVAIAREAGQTEAAVLMRFNNSIAVVMLGLAQVGFLADQPFVGWLLAAIVAVAATIALAGFCVGCFVFFRLRMLQYRVRAGRHA
jgi:hypothetical protein